MFPGRILLIGGVGRDIFSAVADWVDPVSSSGKHLPGKDLLAIFIDLRRASQGSFPAETVEGILDGDFLLGKYRSRPVQIRHPVHVFVYANYPPDRRLLSEDRWNVFWIGGNPGDEEPQPQ